MNIFYLDTDTTACAQAHCDKHVVKMILEYAQLLSTAHRVLDGKAWTDLTANKRRITRYSLTNDKEGVLYKATHINHPSAIWVRESKANYNWLYDLYSKLLAEYTHRYGKSHKCGELSASLKDSPATIADVGLTEMPQAMPEACQKPTAIEGYRNYYSTEKRGMLAYTKRQMPTWITN